MSIKSVINLFDLSANISDELAELAGINKCVYAAQSAASRYRMLPIVPSKYRLETVVVHRGGPADQPIEDEDEEDSMPLVVHRGGPSRRRSAQLFEDEDEDDDGSAAAAMMETAEPLHIVAENGDIITQNNEHLGNLLAPVEDVALNKRRRIAKKWFGEPAMPAMPAMPTMPAMPAMPAMPTMPTMPAMPTVPTMPAMPTKPAMPTMPAMPARPTRPTRVVIKPLMQFNVPKSVYLPEDDPGPHVPYYRAEVRDKADGRNMWNIHFFDCITNIPDTDKGFDEPGQNDEMDAADIRKYLSLTDNNVPMTQHQWLAKLDAIRTFQPSR